MGGISSFAKQLQRAKDSKLVHSAEAFWNRNSWFAVLWVLGAAALAWWIVYHPQSPGFSIGILVLVAGIMSVRPEMRIIEKMAWVALLVWFAVLEGKAIHRSDEEAKLSRDAQNQRFEAIASGLKTSMSQSQYQSTIRHRVASHQHKKQISCCAAEWKQKGVRLQGVCSNGYSL